MERSQIRDHLDRAVMKQLSAADYGTRAVEAARRVLIELPRVLGEYEGELAVVGGWVPDLLMPGRGHIGSSDVDLALDHDSLQEQRYGTIKALLERSGYRPDPDRNFIFYREVALNDGYDPDPLLVEVDLVAAEYGVAGKSRDSQPVQDVRARKARGADLVFDRDLVEVVEIDGWLPNGARFTSRVRVAGPLAFLVMKANAIVHRDKSKDSYDVWFLLNNHPAGLNGLAEAVAGHVDHGLVREALIHLENAFASVDHVGPWAVAGFLELKPETEEYDQKRQDAYQKVRYLLDRVSEIRLSPVV